MFLMALLMTATWMFTSCTDEENGDDGKIPPEEVPGTEEQQLIYSFVKERDVMSNEVVVGIELKNMDGTNYIATEDVHLPFVFSDASTAILGTHFSVRDNVTEFVVPKGKTNATITLDYIEPLEEGKNKIVMNVNAGEDFIAGTYDKIEITIYGPTTVGKLFGKWVFKGTTSFDDIKLSYEGATEETDFLNMPINNSDADTLEFVLEDTEMLRLHVSGDMKNYFRDCEIKYLNDETIQDPYDGSMKTISVMELSKINPLFSASTSSEREGKIWVRILEDGTLELTVFDYEPVDFFQYIYEVMGDMSYCPIIYTFTKVEE